MPEESFETRDFTLKTQQMFSVHTTPEEFENITWIVHPQRGQLWYALLPPQGFGLWAKTRGGIIVSPAYTYKECVKD